MRVERTVKGSGWKKRKATLLFFYGVSHYEFQRMDEMRAANLISELEPMLELQGSYMAQAMWGKDDGKGKGKPPPRPPRIPRPR